MMYNKSIEGGIVMKVIVRGKNIEITEAIESKIVKQLAKLDKYFIISNDVGSKSFG